MSLPLTQVDEVELVREALHIEGSQRRNATRWIKVAGVAILALMVIELVVNHGKGKSIDFADCLIFGSLLFGSCAYGLTPGLRQAVDRAIDLSDKRLLGGMIEAIDSGDPKLKEALEKASTALLTQVTPEDSGLLDDYQLDQLVRAIRVSNNPEFCVAGIMAIGSLGTNHTLHTLEIFLNDPLVPHVRRLPLEPKIRETMVHLRIRLARERLTSGDFER